jgi:outer membrane protein
MRNRGLVFSGAAFLVIGIGFSWVTRGAEISLAPPALPSPGPSANPSPLPPLGIDLDNPEPTMSAQVHPIPKASGPDPYGREPSKLDLEQSIKIALDDATAVLRAKNNLDAAGSQMIQGYAQFLPNVSLVGNYGYQAGKVYVTTEIPTIINTRNWGPSYQVVSDLNLFNGLSDLAALKASLARKDASELTLKRAEQQISVDVAQSYLQVILDQEIVLIARKNLASSQARQKLLEEQTRVGVRNLADLFRQQAETASDESYLISSENKERSDQLLLIRKLRLDVNKNYVLARPTLEEHPASNEKYDNESEMIKIALDNRADYHASQRTADAANQDVKSARAGFLPKLDLQFDLLSYARYISSQNALGVTEVPPSQESFGNQLGNQVSYTIGLALTWNIFDRWVTPANVSRTRAIADNAEVDSVDSEKQVEDEVRQALGDYRAALQQLDSTQSGLLAAQKAYEVMQGRYEVGSASFVDLITAQATLVQAESARAQALIGFALQTRVMENVLGTS